jgi:predicted NBD/HSP70 family sugar kinase
MSQANSLKKSNLFEIIKSVKKNGPITKPEITKLTGLASATVFNLVNELVDKNVLKQNGNAYSQGGRRALYYSFNCNLFYIVGVDIGVNSIAAAIYDLDLNVIDKCQKKFELSENSVEKGINFTIILLKELFQRVGAEHDKILGIGISVPGPVNFSKGTIIKLTNVPKWRNVPLKEILEDELKIMVMIDNDSNNSILSMKWIHMNKEKSDIVYLSTTDGIGMGILINGAIYRGNHYIAGEIGHISVDKNGEKCNCGNRGCIELYSSDRSIVNIIRRGLNNGEVSILRDMCNNNFSNLDMEMIVNAAKNGDDFAKGNLERAGEILSICISNIIKNYDPEEIIIDSTWLRDFTNIVNDLKNNVYEITRLINRDEVRITFNPLKDLFIIGAATLILENQFGSYENCRLLI